MRPTILALAALLLAVPASAQEGPPGGGMPGSGRGGGPGGGGPGSGGPGGGGPGGGRPKMMKPVSRARFDEAVTALFAIADRDSDGRATLAELRAVLAARRLAVIEARFATIDSDRSGTLSPTEFIAWQQGLGSMVLAEARADGPVPEVIEPVLGSKDRDRALARLIEPLNAVTLVNADTNHDAMVTLQEFVALQGARFSAADGDDDGEVSEEELRTLDRMGRRDIPGPGGRDLGAPPERAPPCPPGAAGC
jgi:Ca2+-binding EF-hand superfamily protein